METSVTVVIPAYNAEPFLARALDSVLAQRRRPDEIVVVDDGSTDGTWEVLQQYRDDVVGLRQANAGPAVARNQGVEQSRGAWIAFLDADDFWHPDKLARQLDLLAQHPELRWCACSFRSWMRGRLWQPVYRGRNHARIAETPVLRFFPAMSMGVRFSTCGLIIHRSMFEELGGFDPQLRRGQDLDMWWRIALRYPQIGHIADPLFTIDVDVNPHHSRRNIEGKMRLLTRTLERARADHPDQVGDYLQYARSEFMIRLVHCCANQRHDLWSSMRQQMDDFGVPGWYRVLLPIMARLPRVVRRGLEQWFWRKYHPHRSVVSSDTAFVEACGVTLIPSTERVAQADYYAED